MLNDTSETAADAPAALRTVTVMLWISAGATVLYWVTFFTSGAVQSSSEGGYLAFERAFPAGDAWLAFAAVASALMLARRDPRALLWGLVAGSSFVYLGLLDTLYNLENGKYASIDGAMAVEVMINLFSLSFGPFLIIYMWRHRRWLMRTAG
ncbi:hypothetical protein [Candidatus Binatus sp.]|uniref:hypothetical protein n=1 Tax=Candidatus Binatus sp. TaxID=2811406 RepID=UPI003D0A1E37